MTEPTPTPTTPAPTGAADDGDYFTAAGTDPDRLARSIHTITTSRPHQLAAAGGNPRLALYLEMVDHHLTVLISITHTDLHPYPWETAFNSRMPPKSAALDALAGDWHHHLTTRTPKTNNPT